MPGIKYPPAEPLLAALLTSIQAVLGHHLIGLYLFGSLVGEDFDPEISDIDLMAVVAQDITPADLPRLARMHAQFDDLHPFWHGRIEVGYITPQALRIFPDGPANITVISPGEPINIKPAGADWFINCYVIQEQGVALFGPPPQMLIPPISKQAFRQAVIHQVAEWRDWVIHTQDSRPYQGFAILTMLRALYAVETGMQPSKLQAARWALIAHPEWTAQIEKALHWRKDWRNVTVDPAVTYPETEAFVHRLVDLIVEN